MYYSLLAAKMSFQNCYQQKKQKIIFEQQIFIGDLIGEIHSCKLRYKSQLLLMSSKLRINLDSWIEL